MLGRRWNRRSGNGQHAGGDVAHRAGARFSPHRSSRGANSVIRGGIARAAQPIRKRFRHKAQRHLEGLGVKVHTEHTRHPGRCRRHCCRRPAGLREHGALERRRAGLACRHAGWARPRTSPGRVIVNSDMSIPGHPEVFAIGDTAHVVAPSRNLLGIKAKEPMVMPGVAQPAIQEGRYVARLIRRRVLDSSRRRPSGIGIRAISPSSAVLTPSLICAFCALPDFSPGSSGRSCTFTF